MLIYIVLGCTVLALIGVGVLYNGLVAKRQMVSNGWADIDVQLKRRADLIPQLVATVKGYASHEQKLFEDVIEKRNRALEAGDNQAARGDAETALSRPVGKLFALAESYPDLRSAENFLDLQNELSDTETKIEMARRFFNGAVREMNTAVQSFPGNLIAGMFGFKLASFFEINLSDRAIPEVDLGDRT